MTRFFIDQVRTRKPKWATLSESGSELGMGDLLTFRMALASNLFDRGSRQKTNHRFVGKGQAGVRRAGDITPEEHMASGETFGPLKDLPRIPRVAGYERSAQLPDVPTFKELGLGDLKVTGRFGIYAPKGTPQPILKKLEVDINEAVRTPAITDRIAQSAQSVVAGDAQALQVQYDRDYAIWRGMTDLAGLKRK